MGQGLWAQSLTPSLQKRGFSFSSPRVGYGPDHLSRNPKGTSCRWRGLLMFGFSRGYVMAGMQIISSVSSLLVFPCRYLRFLLSEQCCKSRWHGCDLTGSETVGERASNETYPKALVACVLFSCSADAQQGQTQKCSSALSYDCEGATGCCFAHLLESLGDRLWPCHLQ